MYSQFTMHGQKNIKLKRSKLRKKCWRSNNLTIKSQYRPKIWLLVPNS